MKQSNHAPGGEATFNRSLIDNIQGGVIICTIDPSSNLSKTVYISEGWTELTGYTIEALEREMGGSPTALILPEDAPQAALTYQEQIKMGRSYRIQYRLRHREGRIVWVIDRGVFTQLEEGLLQNQSILTDITPLMESEERLRLSETRFRIATKASNSTVFEFDVATYTYLSIENPEVTFRASFKEIVGWVETAKQRANNRDLECILSAWFHPEDLSRLVYANKELIREGLSQCEARVRQPDRSFIWCKLHLAFIPDEAGKPRRIIGHLVNIDKQHKQTERLRLEAQSDALTGLYNKTAVRELIGKSLQESGGDSSALLMLDVDNFKGVNDSLGHLFGDAVLMDVSAKLKRLFRRDGLAGRIGGDEFVVFLPNVDLATASAKAREVCQVFRHTYSGEKSDYKISCSIGIALSDSRDNFESLFRKADIALYQSKSMGKDQFTVYSSHPLEHVNPDLLYKHKADSDSGRLKIKERIFELLYGSVDFSGSINMILGLLGQLLDAARVYIFENTTDNRFASNIYEWCAEGNSSRRSRLQNFPVESLSYFSLFDQNGVFRCNDFSNLSPEIRDLFAQAGVCSSFQVAIQEDGVIRGFMGYDGMSGPIGPSSEQTDLMIFAAKITGTFIIKKRADEHIRQYNENKMEALDVLPSGIYVIDPDYHLEYMNNLTSNTFPEAKLGMKCYEVFMHNQAPCPNCPGLDCLGHSSSSDIINPYTKMHLLTSASTIRWSGMENRRLICCQILDQPNH